MLDTRTQGQCTLGALFDFQRFAGNARLARMIATAEREAVALDDDDLDAVSAAGDVDAEPARDDENGDKKA